MKLIEVRKIEDCFDGGSRFEYRFEGEIVEPFMRRLAAGNRLDFFPEFPKPFFKIFRENGLQIKGILGSSDFETYFPRFQTDDKKREFEAELHQFMET